MKTAIDHRSNNFDFLRFAAALMVVIGHTYTLNGWHGRPALFGDTIHTIGVKSFFVISGYLVTQSLVGTVSKAQFFWKRTLRIVPGLAACVLVSAFVLGPVVTTLPLDQYYTDPRISTYLWNIAFYVNYSLPGVFEGNALPQVNGSLWSLPVEVFCYVVLGTVGALLIGLGLRGAIVALAFVLIAVGAIIPPSSEPIIFYASNIPTALVLAPYFFVASAMFLFLRREHYRSDVAVACFAALLLIPSLGSATLSIAAKPFLLSYLALSVGLASTATLRSWGRLGDASYGIYLYSFPITQTLILYFGTANLPLLLFLNICVAVAVGNLSWHLVEKRFLKYKVFGLDKFAALRRTS